MEIRQLQYFVAIAEQENFTRAAEQLYIAQSALSRRMRELEAELGVRLFDRHLRGAALTAEGRELLDQARYLLRGFEQLRSNMSKSGTEPSGSVSIGMTPNFSALVAARLAHALHGRFPQIKLRMVEAFSPELRVMLRIGGLDIAVLTGTAAVPMPDLVVEPDRRRPGRRRRPPAGRPLRPRSPRKPGGEGLLVRRRHRPAH